MTPDANGNGLPDEIEAVAQRSPLVKLVAVFAAAAALGGVTVITAQIDAAKKWYCGDMVTAAVGAAVIERTVRLSACDQARVCLEAGAVVNGIDHSYCVGVYEKALESITMEGR